MTSHQEPSADAAAIQAVLAGDLQRFERLIDRHFGSVFAVAMARLRDLEMAEDLAQEVFLRAFLHLKRLDRPELFGAWVSRVARNLAIEWLRRGQRRSQLLPMVPLDEARDAVADTEAKGARDIMASQEEDGALRGAVMALPIDEREVVLLHYGEELSQREIADRMGLSQATVSRRLQRALEALRGALEPTLRREVGTLRAPRPAFARAGLFVLAAAALSGSAKAALASAGPLGSLAGVSGGAAATAGGGGALGVLATTITAGGKLMTTWKGIVAACTAAAAIGGGIYIAKTSGEAGREETAEPPAAIQEVESGVAQTPSVEPPDSEPVAPLPVPPETSSDAEAFLDLIPVDAMIVLYTPTFQDTAERTISFIEKAAGISADNLSEEWTDELPAWAGQGVDVSGPYAMAMRAGNVAAGPDPLFMFSLSDAANYEAHLRAEGAQTQNVSGHDLWVGGRSFPEREIIPRSVMALEGQTVITTFGPDSTERLVEALQPHAPALLARSLAGTPDGSARAVYDLPRIVEQFGPQARELLDQIDAAMANPDSNVGMSFIGINVWQMRDEMRSLLDLGARAQECSLTLTPTQSLDALIADLSLRLSSRATQRNQASHPLALTARIPSDPILAMVCSAPGERGTSILRRYDIGLAKLLVGSDPSGLAALLEHEMTIIESFAPGRAEVAIALYPPATDGEAMPRRVFIDRRGGGIGESARTIVDSLSVVVGYPVRHIQQIGLPDVDFLDSRLEWRGTSDVEGLEVNHFVHTGPGLAGEIDPEDRMAAMTSPQLAFFGPVGEVHHWLVALDDMVILTMEPTPELLGRILRGEDLGIHEPFASVEGDMSPLPQGDFALRLSVGQLLGWIDGLVARVNPSQSGGTNPLTQMAARLQEEEDGIWLGVDTLPGGFDARLTLPATDAHALVGVFVAQRVEVPE